MFTLTKMFLIFQPKSWLKYLKLIGIKTPSDGRLFRYDGVGYVFLDKRICK